MVKRYLPIRGALPANPSGVPYIALPAPTLIATVISTSEIDLAAAYTPGPALATYTFQQASSSSGPWTTLAVQSSASYHNTALASATTYYYRVNVQTSETPSRTSAWSAIQSATTQTSSTLGVMVGAGGKLVSTVDGTTPVYLTLIGTQGAEFGYKYIPALAAVTSTEWSAAWLQWYNWLKTNQSQAIADTYADFNCARLYLNSAAWNGSSGVDSGTNPYHTPAGLGRTLGTNLDGHVIYCMGDTGGTVGTHDGTETDGSGATYQGYVDQYINNVLGATSPKGNTTYVILNLDVTTPVIASNGQRVICTTQPCALSTADLAMWTALAAKYKNNRRVIFEPMNEPYFSAEGTGGTNLINYESALLGNGNGNGNATFSWPNSTSIGYGGSSSYLVNFGSAIAQGAVACSLVSQQQILAAVRAQGANNLVLLGCLVNSGGLFNWSQNGGNQSVTDPLTINGYQQYAAILHSYGYPGSATFSNGKTGAQNILGLIAAGTPFILDEFGTATSVGSTGANGYSWLKANGASGHGMTCWANFDQNSETGTGITTIYNQGSFSMTGINPWSNYNVPNPSSAASQVPTGSN